jgi:hypothetical protein
MMKISGGNGLKRCIQRRIFFTAWYLLVKSFKVGEILTCTFFSRGPSDVYKFGVEMVSPSVGPIT